jgi:hypothetical protein
MNPPSITSASVKVMRSYDYCHFEVTLGTIEPVSVEQVDALRKEAARLADKAVEQYKVAKHAAALRSELGESWRLSRATQTPENERSPDEKAVIKYHQDAAFRARFDYNYDDNWTEPEDEDEDDTTPL